MTEPDSPDEAKIEPVDGLAEDAATRAAAMPQVAVQAHQALSRERVRNRVSAVIVIATVTCGAAVVIAALLGSSRAHDVAQFVFTPFIGLLGAIVGFYFGGQDSTA